MVALWHIHGIHGGMIHWNILYDAWILGFCQRFTNNFFLNVSPPKKKQNRKTLKVKDLNKWNVFHCPFSFNEYLKWVASLEVLVVSLGLTMFISTLYGHIFSSWDSSLSLRPWETVAEDDVPEMSNMQGGKLWSQSWWQKFLIWRTNWRVFLEAFCLKGYLCVFCRSHVCFWPKIFFERPVWVLRFVQWQGWCWSPSSLPSLKVCYGCWLLHSSVVLWHVHACKNVGMYRRPLGRGKELFDLEFLTETSENAVNGWVYRGLLWMKLCVVFGGLWHFQTLPFFPFLSGNWFWLWLWNPRNFAKDILTSSLLALRNLHETLTALTFQPQQSPQKPTQNSLLSQDFQDNFFAPGTCIGASHRSGHFLHRVSIRLSHFRTFVWHPGSWFFAHCWVGRGSSCCFFKACFWPWPWVERTSFLFS